ncbi:methyltransferase domain-containing protein [Candidatus Woesearchaeota archaeon]|nr:methyltransferase domain-containing protein [Candidatus Woesearchaeota archaeon]
MKLNVGAGNRLREDYLNCDIRKTDGLNLVCDTRSLPFQSGSIDEVFSRHTIEHFSLKEALEAMSEWNRVLKKGGELYIICPNLLFHLEQTLHGSHESMYSKKRGENERYWGFGSLFGWQQGENDTHKFGWYYELLRDALEDSGFSEVQNMTGNAKSIEKEEHHLEVKAKKTKEAPNFEKTRLYTLFDYVKH